MMLYQSRNVLCSDFLSLRETSALFTFFFLGTVSLNTMLVNFLRAFLSHKGLKHFLRRTVVRKSKKLAEI